ncbi:MULTISPECIES: helix-turn-helix transcriptional regulator [unclassified Frankia]|uniref:helix-turn-helix domain-containing protein n=1 Tax=unclassified Frankia TaxID=2632575 RepID=UPI002AD2EA2F|nr:MULTISPECIES: helix-turn-helix transcriptional regulator [unclassified Frankia]
MRPIAPNHPAREAAVTSRNHELPAPPAGLWDRPDMAQALDLRDMATVLKTFQKWTGATQGQIATACGMPQSHISEIRNGKRQVITLTVFERLASGLNLPRARLGLDDETTHRESPTTTATGSDEPTANTPAQPTRRTVSLGLSAAIGIEMLPGELVTTTARESAAFVQRIGSATVDPLLIEQLADDVARLAVDAIATPPEDMLAEAHHMRTQVFAALDQGCRPGQMRDLYLIGGQLSGILAYAALDLDKPRAAMTNARSALMCADMAGHTGLAIWVRGTQSLIARFATRYADAHQYIHAGMALHPTGAGLARLASGEAQCLAHFGDSTGTRAALTTAVKAIDNPGTPGDIDTGLFTFTRAKTHYYGASSLIWFTDRADAAAAEDAATTAIDLFQNGPSEERFLTDEILAHIYLATARLILGNIDGVVDALQPVLTIPQENRVSWHRRRLDRIASMLNAQRYHNADSAADLRHEIAAF